MHLDAIMCLDGVPTIYLKEFHRPATRRELNELQRRFWNQGTGTILLILDPVHLYVFSGMVLPTDDEGDILNHPALVDRLDRVADTLDAYQLVTRVASGSYYRQYTDKFKISNTVDQHLVDNLGYVGDRLQRGNSVKERKRVHAFLGRIIFTCYLVDRGIVELADYSFVRKQSVSSLLDLLTAYPTDRARDILYRVFEQLRVDFNGSMFETDLDAEKRTIIDEDISTLISFLEGHELGAGQRTLGFWAYDFASIPVETISAIYEKFLEEEEPSVKDDQGAFYTPRHLAEMVVDEATSHVSSLLDNRCLDPACGSGILLVILFNRMAAEYEYQNPRAQTKKRLHDLLDVLENQICGIDVNVTACRIACFSLYIAYLDQFDSRTLKELQRQSDKILPNLLAYKEQNYNNTDTPVIYEGNFFEPKLPIRDDFQVIVGNPPWVGRNQPSNAEVTNWVESEEANPFLAEAPRTKPKRKAIFLPQSQIAHAFMWKVPLHLAENGRACLLLPIQVLLNRTDEFQHHWFAKMQVHRIFDLSDYRFFLFQHAIRPASIVSFSNHVESTDNVHRVEYIAPKVRKQDPRGGLIRVFPSDRKWVDNGDILAWSRTSSDTDDDEPVGAAVFWKSLSWGTPRDVAFIEYLLRLERLGEIAGKPGEGKRWTKGKGFQPWYQIAFDQSPETYGPPKPIPGRLDEPYIRTVDDSLQMFSLVADTITLRERLDSIHCRGYPEDELTKASKDGFRRSPSRLLYEPPFVLVNDGFSRFSFVDFFAFYSDSLTGIGGEEDDADLLRFFTVYAQSRLADYFLAHSASSLGVERPHVRVHELMRLPFPLPNSNKSHRDAEAIVREVASRMKRLQANIAAQYTECEASDDFKLRGESLAETRREQVERLRDELEPLIYRYFKLTDSEIAYIEDTCNVVVPSATPTSPEKPIRTTQPTTATERQAYGDLLCKTLNTWSKADQRNGRQPPFWFAAECTHFAEIGMAMVTLSQREKQRPTVETEARNRLTRVVDRLTRTASYEEGSFEYLRGVIFAEGKKIRILKPDMLGQWTRTAALTDADEIFHAIVQSSRRQK